MANPRQRRKLKSSTAKVRNKSRPKWTDPKSNPLIAQHWDKTLTFAQNYKKLGLTSRLNARTGGVEKKGPQVAGTDNIATPHHDPLAIVSATSKTRLDPEEVLVERDPATGKILRITDPKWQKNNPLNDPLNEVHSEDEKESEVQTEFVRDLEEQAANEAPAKGRAQSKNEQEWIEELVKKYGNDSGAMFRDRKMNVYQLSEGDIKKRIKKWQASRAKEGKECGG